MGLALVAFLDVAVVCYELVLDARVEDIGLGSPQGFAVVEALGLVVATPSLSRYACTRVGSPLNHAGVDTENSDGITAAAVGELVAASCTSVEGNAVCNMDGTASLCRQTSIVSGAVGTKLCSRVS